MYSRHIVDGFLVTRIISHNSVAKPVPFSGGERIVQHGIIPTIFFSAHAADQTLTAQQVHYGHYKIGVKGSTFLTHALAP
jgi:hypothetical protein